MVDASLREALAEGLRAGCDPETVQGLAEAEQVLPVFGLVRSLFSTSHADSALKLVVLFALAELDGRFSRERIRQAVRDLDPGRLDALVTSLYQGGWLELRARDDTYRLAPLGLFLLAVLRSANFGTQSATNLIVRATEALAFGSRVDAEGGTTERLLSMLLAHIETVAERASEVMRRGSPRLLMRFSRMEVRDQLAHVQAVLSELEESLDASSAVFGRVVRLHEAIQTILRTHEGVARRLAEWNLHRLEATDAGYSLTALCDAVMAATDDELEGAWVLGGLSSPANATAMSLDELLTRHRTARVSRRAEVADRIVYTPPPPPEAQPLSLQDVDPVARLRAALDELAAAAPDEPIELAALLRHCAEDFADAALHVALVARLEGADSDYRIEAPPAAGQGLRGADPAEALAAMVRLGVLAPAGEDLGLHSALRFVRVVGEP